MPRGNKFVLSSAAKTAQPLNTCTRETEYVLAPLAYQRQTGMHAPKPIKVTPNPPPKKRRPKIGAPPTQPEEDHPPLPKPATTSVSTEVTCPKPSEPSKVGDVLAPAKPVWRPAPRAKAVMPTCWAEKYRPGQGLSAAANPLTELVGNRDLVQTLQQWIKNRREAPGTTPRVAMLLGPPGVGKTTAAHMLLKHAGYQVWEVNASDTNTGHQLLKITQDVTHTVSTRRIALVIDEVDGLYEGGPGKATDDSGAPNDFGMRAWLEGLEKLPRSAPPIILIANESKQGHIRHLVKQPQLCKTFRFGRLFTEAIVARAHHILTKENVTLSLGKLHDLARTCNGDLRQLLVNLQMQVECSRAKQGGVCMNLNPDTPDAEFGNPFGMTQLLLQGGSRFELEKTAFTQEATLVNALAFENYLKTPAMAQANLSAWKHLSQPELAHRKRLAQANLADLKQLSKLADTMSAIDEGAPMMLLQPAFRAMPRKVDKTPGVTWPNRHLLSWTMAFRRFSPHIGPLLPRADAECDSEGFMTMTTMPGAAEWGYWREAVCANHALKDALLTRAHNIQAKQDLVRLMEPFMAGEEDE